MNLRAFRDPVALFLLLAVLLCVLAVMPTQSSSRHDETSAPRTEAVPALTPVRGPTYSAAD